MGCPVRDVLDRIGDKWGYLVVLRLSAGPTRFGQLRRNIGDISQRMLTETLRNLQRDGLVARAVFDASPPGVEYRLTALGESLLEPMQSLVRWAALQQKAVAAARAAFDGEEKARPASAVYLSGVRAAPARAGRPAR